MFALQQTFRFASSPPPQPSASCSSCCACAPARRATPPGPRSWWRC